MIYIKAVLHNTKRLFVVTMLLTLLYKYGIIILYIITISAIGELL